MAQSDRKAPNQKVEISISTATLTRVVVTVLVILLTIGLFGRMADALVIVFVAFFLALALNAPVHWLASRLPGKRRGSRALGTSIAFLIVVAVIGGFIALLAPSAVRQTGNFIQSIPNIVDSIRDENSTVGHFVKTYDLQDDIDELTDSAVNATKASTGKIFSSIGSGFVTTLSTFVLTFMMLVEGPRWVRRIKRLIPRDKRARTSRLVRDMYGVIRGFVNGQVTLAGIAALCILPVMLVMGVPYAGALAVVVFIAGLVPMLGHYVGATIVTLVALSHSWVSALVVLGFYILYQQVESYTLQPRVQATNTSMSPLLVFLAVVLGANFSGLLGALVAIPIAGCLRILLLEVLATRGISLAPEPSVAPVKDDEKPTKK